VFAVLRLGDLTYGIYLNHFFVAATLLWIAEIFGSPIFGRYNKPEFGFWATIAWRWRRSTSLSAPVERLRRLIKKQSSLPALPGLPAANPTVVTAG
jgi:hypothetical protein